MLLPPEIALLFLGLGISLIWDALRREESAPRRAAMGLSALGCLMIAVAGRFPPLPGATGFSPGVTAGALLAIAGLFASTLVSVIAFVRNRWRGTRPSDR